MRFKVNIPPNMIPAAAGSQIHIFEAGTGNHLAQNVYADPNTQTPLANPYPHPGGKVAFYVAQPAKVQVGVQPAGAAVPVVSPPVHASEKVFSYGLMRSGGQAVMWVLT